MAKTPDFVAKSPDQVTEKLREGFVWTTQHLALFVGVVVALVIGAIAAFVIDKTKGDKAVAAQKELSVIQAGFEEEQKKFIEAQKGKKDPSMEGFLPSEGKVAELSGLAAKMPATPAGQIAALESSRYYNQMKKFDLAQKTIESALDQTSSSLMKSLLIDSLALTYSNQGQCESLEKLAGQVSADKSIQFANGSVGVRLALCYLDQKKTEQAVAYLSGLKMEETDPAKKIADGIVKSVKLSKTFEAKSTQ